ncbi:uncharacterized protein LOC132036497 [Lycium ferocissimum]|uniref:uncharacterized protein LOC132036497 n=1 Tax=Lycium ferocissimum TaxID=112874 RepID=UPI0028156A56|nr:uncharacterized protein LOC132036497 [Lycium ferocissimum]
MERVNVYLRGISGGYDLWYRMELNKSDREIVVGPVAKLCHSTYGTAGNWTVIGSNIYYAGGFLTDRFRINPYKELIKHNTEEQVPVDYWETESTLNLSRMSPVVAAVAVGKKRKLCVLGGDHIYIDNYQEILRGKEETDDPLRNKGGEIYDIEGKYWNLVDTELESFPRNYKVASVVEKDGDEPTEIVFYCLAKGAMMFFNAITRKISKNETVEEFALWHISPNSSPDTSPDSSPATSPPRPPQFLSPDANFHLLRMVTDTVPAVFTNNTFYWFTLDMYLYAYDVKARRWFTSQCLYDQFLAQCPKLQYNTRIAVTPILVGLPQDGKFVVILPQESSEQLIMACFKVEMQINSLNVLTELVQLVYLVEESSLLNVFWFYDGKAISVEG